MKTFTTYEYAREDSNGVPVWGIGEGQYIVGYVALEERDKIAEYIKAIYSCLKIEKVTILRHFVQITNQLKAAATIEYTYDGCSFPQHMGGFYPIRDSIDEALNDIKNVTGQTKIDIENCLPTEKVYAAFLNQSPRWM